MKIGQSEELMLNVQLDLENLGTQFTDSLRPKEQWQWKEHLLPTIEEVKKEFPNFDNHDIGERLKSSRNPG